MIEPTTIQKILEKQDEVYMISGSPPKYILINVEDYMRLLNEVSVFYHICFPIIPMSSNPDPEELFGMTVIVCNTEDIQIVCHPKFQMYIESHKEE